MGDYYDKAGKPIEMMEFVKLFENYDYKVVARHEDERISISTVWLGIDHNFSRRGQPVIFETMVFVKEGADINPAFDELQWRWRTEDEAKEGHDVILKCYREGLNPEAFTT